MMAESDINLDAHDLTGDQGGADDDHITSPDADREDRLRRLEERLDRREAQDRQQQQDDNLTKAWDRKLRGMGGVGSVRSFLNRMTENIVSDPHHPNRKQWEQARGQAANWLAANDN